MRPDKNGFRVAEHVAKPTHITKLLETQPRLHCLMQCKSKSMTGERLQVAVGVPQVDAASLSGLKDEAAKRVVKVNEHFVCKSCGGYVEERFVNLEALEEKAAKKRKLGEVVRMRSV